MRCRPEDDELPVREKEALFTLTTPSSRAWPTALERRAAASRRWSRGDVFTKLGQFNGFADTLLASDELQELQRLREHHPIAVRGP